MKNRSWVVAVTFIIFSLAMVGLAYMPGMVARVQADIPPNLTPKVDARAIVSGFGAKTPIPLPTNNPLWASGRNAPIGAECDHYLGYSLGNQHPGSAPMWESAPSPANCTPGDGSPQNPGTCTSTNISWSNYDNCIAAMANTYVTLGDGSQVKEPISIQVPPMILDEGDSGDSDGSTAKPWEREYIPGWMETKGYLFKFLYDEGDGNANNNTYWGIRYDGDFKAWMIKMIYEAGQRYGDNDQIVMVRVGVGYQQESQPVKRQALGDTKNKALRVEHQKTVSCDAYRDYVFDLVEAARKAFPNKVVTFSAAPSPCGDSGYSSSDSWRYKAYEWTTAGNPGWHVNGTPVALALHSADVDSANAESWNPDVPRYDPSYGWMTAGDQIDKYGYPVVWEYFWNPAAPGAFTAGQNEDPWQKNYWTALAVAGHGGDYIMPFSTHAQYYTNKFWDTVWYMTGPESDRAWVVLRDAEHPEFSWSSSTYGRAGYMEDLRSGAIVLTPDAYTQACSSSVKATATAEYGIQQAANNTMGYNPCPNTLPTPAATYQATPTFNDAGETNMIQRLYNRQARQMTANQKMGIALESSWKHYSEVADVKITVSYLDIGTDDVVVRVNKNGSTENSHTIDKVNSGLWKDEVWAVTDAELLNNISVTGRGSSFLEITNGATSVLNLHQVFVDVTTVTVTDTPTPTPTNTPTATPTATNTPTATPTNTPVPVYGTDLLQNLNGNFELGTLANWTLANNTNGNIIENQSANYYGPTHAAHINYVSSNPGNPYMYVCTPTLANTYYRWSFYYKSSNNYTGWAVKNQAGGTWISPQWSYLPGLNAWTRATIDFQTPANGTNTCLYLTMYSLAKEVWIDDNTLVGSLYPQGLKLNEVSDTEMYDWNLSGTVNEADRWIEVYNDQAFTASIGGYTIYNQTTTGSYTFAAGTTVCSKCYKIVLAEDGAPVSDNSSSVTYQLKNGATVINSLPAPMTTVGTCSGRDPNGSLTITNNLSCTPGQIN